MEEDGEVMEDVEDGVDVEAVGTAGVSAEAVEEVTSLLKISFCIVSV
jgi:hypothetical protein